MRLVSVLNRAATIEFEPEELFALAESMGDAFDGFHNRMTGETGEKAREQLIEAWGAAFRAMGMAAASCSYVSPAHTSDYSLRLVERETRERRSRKRA